MPVVFSNEGRRVMLERAFNSSPTRSVVNKLWVGTNQATPTIADTDLTLPVPIVTATVETVDSCDVVTGWSGTGDASNVETETSTVKTGTALRFGKTGTSSTWFAQQKLTASLDFANKRLYQWTYLTGTGLAALSGTGARLKFGSGTGDYYYQDFAKTVLSSGWNLLSLTGSSPTGTTGTPIAASCDFSEIKFYTSGTGATGTGDFIMDYWHAASSADYPVSLSSGYPTDPTSAGAITLRGFINDNQANGYVISGAAFKNSDGTPIMTILGSFADEGKSSSEQLVIFSIIKLKQFSSTE